MSGSQPQPKRFSRPPRRVRGIRESLVAIVLGFEAIVVGLGALTMLGLKAIDLTQAIVGGGIVVAVLIAGALLARFTFGLVLGWLAQAAVMATGFIVGAMFVVGIVFTAMWVYALVQGARIDQAKKSRNNMQPDGEDTTQ
jgi:fatty acid desaturase